MSDDLRKIRPGEKRVLTRGRHNAFVDAAQAHRQRMEQTRGRRTGPARRNVCEAYNAASEAAPRYGVVELAGTSNTQAQVEFVKPGDADGTKRYGLTTEPIRPGEIGRVAVGGGPWEIIVSPLSDVPEGTLLGPESGSWGPVSERKCIWRVINETADDHVAVVFLETPIIAYGDYGRTFFTVHSGGDGEFASIQAVFDHIISNYPAADGNREAYIEVLDGHTEPDDLNLYSYDMSWAVLTEENSNPITFNGDHIRVRDGAVLPVMTGSGFDCGGSAVTVQIRDRAGIILDGGFLHNSATSDFQLENDAWIIGSGDLMDGNDGAVYVHENSTLRLRYTTIGGSVGVTDSYAELMDCTINGDVNINCSWVNLNGATVKNNAGAEYAISCDDSMILAAHSDLQGDVNLDDCASVDIPNASISGSLELVNSNVAAFRSTEISGDVSTGSSSGLLNFNNATINGTIDVDHAFTNTLIVLGIDKGATGSFYSENGNKQISVQNGIITDITTV